MMFLYDCPMKDGIISVRTMTIWPVTSLMFLRRETVENPELVVRGNKGTLKATRNTGRDNWLVVVYKEVSKADGFIITAYFLEKKPKGEVIWRRR